MASVDDRYGKVVNGIYFAISQSILLVSGISKRKNVAYLGGQKNARKQLNKLIKHFFKEHSPQKQSQIIKRKELMLKRLLKI